MSNETKFLLDTLTKNLILKVVEYLGCSMKEAMDIVYNSQLYEKIIDTETGLYFQSAGYNFELLKKEMLTGKL